MRSAPILLLVTQRLSSPFNSSDEEGTGFVSSNEVGATSASSGSSNSEDSGSGSEVRQYERRVYKNLN